MARDVTAYSLANVRSLLLFSLLFGSLCTLADELLVTVVLSLCSLCLVCLYEFVRLLASLLAYSSFHSIAIYYIVVVYVCRRVWISSNNNLFIYLASSHKQKKMDNLADGKHKI